MASNTVLTIHRTFRRAETALVEKLAGVPTGFAVDALGRSGALDPAIRPLVAGSFCGTALTVETVPRDNLAPWAALSLARPGDVLVVATGPGEASVMGDILIGMARNAGIVAVVTDGYVRDIGGLEEVGIPVLARGLSPNSPFKNGPGVVGAPIAIGGRSVAPGDIVLGDRDGAVVVPADKAARVIAALEGVREKERRSDEAVRAGAVRPDWLEARMAQEDVAYVD